MDVDGDGGVAVERIGAEAAVGRELAGREIHFKLAEIDSAIALRIGGVDCA